MFQPSKAEQDFLHPQYFRGHRVWAVREILKNLVRYSDVSNDLCRYLPSRIYFPDLDEGNIRRNTFDLWILMDKHRS